MCVNDDINRDIEAQNTGVTTSVVSTSGPVISTASLRCLQKSRKCKTSICGRCVMFMLAQQILTYLVPMVPWPLHVAHAQPFTVGALQLQGEDGVIPMFHQEVVLRGAAKMVRALETLDPNLTADVVHGKAGEYAHLLSGGTVFEKASIHVGKLSGSLPAELQQLTGQNYTAGSAFEASSLSVVIHPRNPLVPIMHFNYRCFQVGDSVWIGGGSDLTPSYINEKDCKDFHSSLKAVCDAEDETWYPTMKTAADKYFRIPHRGESRGIGGIIFDGLRGESVDLTRFAGRLVDATVATYSRIVERRRFDPYTPEQKHWQSLRRGRYIEFNFLYDRGTHWGLKMPGFVDPELVLLATPPTAEFVFRFFPAEGRSEGQALDVFKNPRDWASDQRFLPLYNLR